MFVVRENPEEVGPREEKSYLNLRGERRLERRLREHAHRCYGNPPHRAMDELCHGSTGLGAIDSTARAQTRGSRAAWAANVPRCTHRRRVSAGRQAGMEEKHKRTYILPYRVVPFACSLSRCAAREQGSRCRRQS